MDDKTALAYAITRALAYQENGGSIDSIKNPKAGKTGELKSIFQFEPETWKKDAQQFLGDPNAPMTPDNETKVVTSQVSKWIDKGYNSKQMASMWNAGVGEPDAYTGKFSDGSSSVGVNPKYGVKFDVPTYADNVANYAKKFYTEDFSKQIKSPHIPNTPTQQTSQSATPAPQPGTGNITGMLNGLATASG